MGVGLIYSTQRAGSCIQGEGMSGMYTGAGIHEPYKHGNMNTEKEQA
ncbi:MAG: hypothetical protein WKF91_22815 [Segetibacter sp.]